MNDNIMTVTGAISPECLGVTSMHEHLIWDDSLEDADPNRRNDDEDDVINETRHYVSSGGRTIVELTCRGLKQDIIALRRISEESGVQIVAATGFYRECYYPEYVFEETDDQLAERMIQDCRFGVDGSGIFPGIIGELASEFRAPGLSPNEEKVFRAGGKASVITGLSVSTHCWQGGLAMEQIRALVGEGVQPERIVIGHLAVAHGPLDRVLNIADEGVFLGIDCIGYQLDDFGDEDRADMVKGLIDRGYLDQITISQDVARRSLFRCHGGHGYSYLVTVFADMLRKRGISADQIRAVLVDNPRRILTRTG